MGYRGTYDSLTVFEPEDDQLTEGRPHSKGLPFLPACKIMVSSLTAEPAASTTPRSSLKASAREFQLLGLRPREARLEVIRRALTDTAGDVKASEHWVAEDCTTGKRLQHDDGRLAQVAVAGYRLLDPRRRRTLFERVQLLLWTEEDPEAPTNSLWDTAAADEPNAVQPAPASLPASRSDAAPAAKPIDACSVPPVASTTQLGEETQAALEVFRSLRSRDRRATALWISVAGLAISLPGAVALVLALI